MKEQPKTLKERIVELREKNRLSYPKIAARVNCSVGYAHKTVKQARKEKDDAGS